MTTRYYIAAMGVGLLAACASSRGATSNVAEPSTRFRDLSSVVMATREEIRLVPGTGQVQYPDAERRGNIEAAFAFAFLLDTEGRVEQETISFIGGAAPAFLDEACRWLRFQRFEPVYRGGVPQRAFVVSELSFTLDHSLHDGSSHPVLTAPFVNTEKLRREFAAKGIAQSTRELEGRRHCQ